MFENQKVARSPAPLSQSQLDSIGPDLFFALRGAGSSFAVVTEVVLKTFPGPEPAAWQGQIGIRRTDATLHSNLNGIESRDEFDALAVARILRALPSAGYEGQVRLTCDTNTNTSLWSDVLLV